MRVTGNVAPVWFMVGAVPAHWGRFGTFRNKNATISPFDASFPPPITVFELRSRIQGSANCWHVECFDRYHSRVGWHINPTKAERQPSTPADYPQYPLTSWNAVQAHQS